MGKMEYCLEHIDRACDMGADAVKFQLFGDDIAKNGNIKLPLEWWPDLWEYADGKIPITASVFNDDALKLLLQYPVPFVKFAFSQKQALSRIEKTISSHIEAIVSCDVMTAHLVPLGVKKLFCVPEYPVQYQIDFENIFPRFDGFSSHTLGTLQDERSIQFGARIIEKHMTLDHADINCPDSYFALKPKEMEKLAETCRNSS
jgi:sialic acid synthase SpsE